MLTNTLVMPEASIRNQMMVFWRIRGNAVQLQDRQAIFLMTQAAQTAALATAIFIRPLSLNTDTDQRAMKFRVTIQPL